MREQGLMRQSRAEGIADFVKVGIPLDLACAGLAIALIPIVWPF